MSTRKLMFALAAITTLGTMSLAPTSASAFGFGGHGGGGHFGGHVGGVHFGGHFGGHAWGHFAGHAWGHGLGFNHWGVNHLAFNRWGFNHWPHDCHLGAWCRPGLRVGGYPRYGFGGGIAYGSGVNYSAPSSAPAPAAGCLTKQELPNGSALFQDVCTQEQAESQPQQGGAPGQ